MAHWGEMEANVIALSFPCGKEEAGKIAMCEQERASYLINAGFLL